MAIVKMNKFSAIGLDTTEEALVASLMDLGVAELNSQDSKLADEEWSALVSRKGKDIEVAELDGELNTIDNALKTLDAYDTSKKPLFKTRKAITEKDFSAVIADRDDIDKDIDKVISLGNRIKDLKANQNKIEAAVVGLTPWTSYMIPLEIHETRFTNVVMGIVSSSVNVSEMESSMEAVTSNCEISAVGSDEDQNYLSLIYLKDAEEEVNEVLKQFGFNKIYFKELKGTVTENIAVYNYELNSIAKDIKDVEQELTGMVASEEKIQWLHDQLVIEQDKAKAQGNMLKTGRAFYIDGWVPRESEDELKSVLDRYGCYYEIVEPEKDEETPVLLKNNSFVYPIEAITNLYSLPKSTEVDPTPIYAVFYLCFFGMMFGDFAYGLVLAIITFIVLKKFPLEGMAHKLIKMLFFGSISTMIWGALFGGYFGNLISVIAKTYFGISFSMKPLWFDPLAEPMRMLVYSCILGTVHIFIGMGVKAYILLRDGKFIDAVNDVFAWYLLIIGVAMMLFGGSMFASAGSIGKWLAIAGAVLIVAIPAFTANGVGRALGLWNLYGATGYVADILSYSRLLALGLASAVIAQVINTLGGMFGSTIIAAILFLIVGVGGHTFNFAINGLGSYVHGSRLQYVEFFGKFYEGGGVAFKPFIKRTKYVKIVKEDK